MAASATPPSESAIFPWFSFHGNMADSSWLCKCRKVSERWEIAERIMKKVGFDMNCNVEMMAEKRAIWEGGYVYKK
jgi:hypothetical protein